MEGVEDGASAAGAWLAEAWAALTAGWAALPPAPDLDLPPVFDWAVVVVIATTLLAISATAVVSGWVERRTSWFSLFALAVAAALFFWVWEANRTVTWTAVPEAFVEIVARILR